MNVWLKRVLFGLVIALIIAVVGLAIFLLTFNPNAYKSKLEDLVYARYGRTLTIEGDIGLSLFPRIGLSVKDVSLSNRGSKDLFVSVDSARFAVAIWPLLSNQLVVDHVAINGLKAWVVRTPKGHFNFDDLLESRRAAPPAPAGKTTAPGGAVTAPLAPADDSDLNIDIAGLELKGGQINYRDLRDGVSTTVTGIEANTGRVTYDQPFDVAIKATLKGDDPVQDAKLDAQALLRLNPGGRGYSAQKINVQLTGRLGNLDQARATLKGNVAYDSRAHNFSAGNLELAVAGDIVGAHPIQGLQANLTASQLRLDSRNAQLKVSKLALRASGKDQGRAVELALDAPALVISPETAQGDPVTGTIKWAGSDTLAASLKLEGLSGNASEWQFRSVGLDGNVMQGKRLLRLRLTSPLSWNSSLRKGALSAIKGDIGVQDQELPQGGYEAPMIGSVHVDLVRDVLDADLNAVVDGGQAAFKAQVKKLAQPEVNFSFSTEKLDLNRWMPVPPGAVKVQAPPKAGDAKPDVKAKPDTKAKPDAKTAPAPAPAPATFDLSFLKGRNIRGTVKIGDLRVRDVQLTKLSAQADVQKNTLTISKLAAHLYQGTLSGKLTASSDQTLGLNLTLDKVSVAPLLQALGARGLVSGLGGAQIDLTAQGATLPALEKSLSGQVTWQVRDGAIHGVDATQTLSDVSGALGNVLKGRLDAVPSPFQKGRSTPFSTLEGRVDLKDGIGTVSKLALVSQLVRVSEGKPAQIDLPARSLDLMLQIQVAAHPPKVLAASLGSLAGATIPVRISGPWADPKYDVVWSEVHNQAIQQALKSGLMQLLSGKDLIQQALPAPAPAAEPSPKSGTQRDTVERLGNALKGLLGQ
ncbi:MAG: AsmA family protein [Castellaniella sp.]|uniref:AsmA family protein n=1 Tax=Castellaniella sp. TaxID=1955812 RepID=UPI0012220252|nr:AsmA family protein [Castellaniella sp.]TAN27353.1 MAG: AsmA family protein [Castellaniella sp.]